jgi:Gpi18-like mannosyltransferase
MKNKLGIVLAIACIFSLSVKIFLAFNYDTGDTGAMNLASSLFVQHQEVYGNPQVYFSPPPFSLHVFAVIQKIAQKTGLPFSGLWKMPAVFSDMGLGILIYVICRQYYKRSKEKSTRLTLWYVLNPITWYVSGFHGQSEAVWIFLILLAWYFLYRYGQVVFAALCTALALAYKLPAILLFPALLLTLKKRNQQILFIVVVGVLFIGSLFPEIITSQSNVVRQVFLYSSALNIWGFTSVARKFLLAETAVHLIPLLAAFLKIVLFGTLGWTYFKYLLMEKKDFFCLCLIVITVFLVFTPGFGIQYLLWPLPFLILVNHPWKGWYTFFTTFAFWNTYGISWKLLTEPVSFLQLNLFYKFNMLYPYDLYFPVWILLAQSLRIHPKKIPSWQKEGIRL